MLTTDQRGLPARVPASLTLNDSTKMPSTLAFGTGTALYGKSAEEQVIQALDAGFTHLDLAASERCRVAPCSALARPDSSRPRPS